MIAVGKNGGLVSIPRLMLYSDKVQREEKRGINIMKYANAVDYGHQ
jgi:hypothetical protein